MVCLGPVVYDGFPFTLHGGTPCRDCHEYSNQVESSTCTAESLEASGSSLTELRLWLEPDGDPELLGYESVDTEGNRTTLHLIDVDYGRKLTPEQFQFEVPSLEAALSRAV